jgi:peptide chain release factor 1
MNDIKIDVMRASGAGGQSVNRTESAVRLHHIPTGLIVHCQEGKSQTSNKEKAFKILASKLQMLEDEKARKEASDARLEQIGTGDRSEKIRTYNFPQDRISDHRIHQNWNNIATILEGDLEPIITALREADEALEN